MTTTDHRLRPMLAATLSVGLWFANAPTSAAAADLPQPPATPAAATTIVPDQSWTCAMPAGIVPPTLGTLAFRLAMRIGASHDAGTTQYGHRRVLDVTGGTIDGTRVQGTVLTGGLDLELTLSNGSTEVEQVGMLRLRDGTVVYMRNCGVAASDDQETRIVGDFEVANSSAHAWLNTGKFVATRTVDLTAGTIELAFYDVSSVSAPATKVQLKDPAGVPNQTWECQTATGTRGASVFTESVALGSSLSVGASKRGTRNVIPITGGKVSGRVTGTVVPGGADYQLMSTASAKLDARYALLTTDGTYILVRNCGPFGALVPVFETRADGPYAFLNANKYLSSDPGFAAGGVSITFYERR